MHREFRKLLNHAEGESDFVLVANLDIRGFSAWSQEVESVQAAMYLAKLYPVVIDRWFKRKWFFKPTGDGLLLVRAFKEKELQNLATETLEGCLEIVEEFGTLCLGKPLLNFDLPSEVGIGLAQGAASRLVSKDKTLDYSGAILNRASRLMDLARPRGVVFDGGLARGLLPDSLQEKFESAEVYLRGVSPKDPLQVYFLKGPTEIPTPNLSPIGEIKWGKPITDRITLKDMETPATSWTYYTFPEAPRETERIKCTVGYPAMNAAGKRVDDSTMTEQEWAHTTSFELEEKPGGVVAKVDRHTVAQYLREQGVKGPWPVVIRIDYPV